MVHVYAVKNRLNGCPSSLGLGLGLGLGGSLEMRTGLRWAGFIKVGARASGLGADFVKRDCARASFTRKGLGLGLGPGKAFF